MYICNLHTKCIGVYRRQSTIQCKHDDEFTSHNEVPQVLATGAHSLQSARRYSHSCDYTTAPIAVFTDTISHGHCDL